ncbi:hypothetical protein P153DRAFT_385324 [Dothidotthia symphoricarpi CBS 119687]|uniref:Uncharacterized protein n=1 Tax=Dothidotthia symphoricarpi CBS 119687 TaxID=1392245 RepID=A0A6A6ADZ8_9PLEO|nr:uncharacterized protein P153DRAFT_385324 [Dothidotthia symphoricarpi CBS 119687]KAF2130089.1 hypothetical protein P153DRAFT_385324 [Dothidotthia symphoricarpi CBS 119687]
MPNQDHILILGRDEVTQPLLLTDIPQSSFLLVQLSNLPPRDRYIRLPALTTNMVAAYCELPSVDVLVRERDWMHIVNLAITAEILQDPVVETTAITALKRKARAEKACTCEQAVHDHIRDFTRNTGGGVRIVQIMEEIWRNEKRSFISTTKERREEWKA